MTAKNGQFNEWVNREEAISCVEELEKECFPGESLSRDEINSYPVIVCVDRVAYVLATFVGDRALRVERIGVVPNVRVLVSTTPS